jgi:hypothetical protein
MVEEINARLHALETWKGQTDHEVLRLRDRTHKLEGEVPTLKLNMSELAIETRTQTPLIREVHTAVLGPEGLGEQVRKHDRYQAFQTRIMLGVLIPLLAMIALATCTSALTKKTITPDDAKRIVETLKEKP